jgi:hypothetical protein
LLDSSADFMTLLEVFPFLVPCNWG